MYIYNKLNRISGILKEREARIRDPTMHSSGILHKAEGDHFDQIHSEQKILEMIMQRRLVLIIGGKKSQN
jgi:hypothetical protein